MIKKVLGNRVYLELPPLPESKLELTPEIAKIRQEELLVKMAKLKVIHASDSTASYTEIKVGDIVLVDPNALMQRRYSYVTLKNQEALCVSYTDIMHIWE